MFLTEKLLAGIMPITSVLPKKSSIFLSFTFEVCYSILLEFLRTIFANANPAAAATSRKMPCGWRLGSGNTSMSRNNVFVKSGEVCCFIAETQEEKQTQGDTSVVRVPLSDGKMSAMDTWRRERSRRNVCVRKATHEARKTTDTQS